MRKIYKFLTSEKIIIISLSLILLAFSYGPLFIQYLTPPPGKVFLGVFGFPPDFYGNLISFQEGQAGLWRLLDKTSSTTPAPPVWLKLEYRLLGKISRLLPFEMTVSFHLTRFFLSIILLLVSWQLIGRVFNKKYQRICAFLLAFFSTSITIIQKRLLIFAWSPLGVFQRAAYFQHYLLAFIFTLTAIILLNQALTAKSIKKLLIAAIFGFLAGFIHAFNLISLFLTLPFLFFLDRNKSRKKLLLLIIFVLISSLALLYQYYIRQFPPWTLFSNIEMQYNLINDVSSRDFIFGIGPTLFLGLAGAYLALKKGGYLNLLLAPWAVIYLLGFWFLWRFLNLNSARFLQTPFYIILGILSVYVIEILAQKRAKYVLIITFFILLLSLPACKQSLLMNQHYCVDNDAYASPDYLEALSWLTDNGRQTDIFLSTKTNGMVIAARAGLMPYLATFSNILPTYSTLKANVESFFSQKWNSQQAENFIKEQQIKFVFFSPEEKALSATGRLDYPFLYLVFTNSQVSIFKITPNIIN